MALFGKNDTIKRFRPNWVQFLCFHIKRARSRQDGSMHVGLHHHVLVCLCQQRVHFAQHHSRNNQGLHDALVCLLQHGAHQRVPQQHTHVTNSVRKAGQQTLLAASTSPLAETLHHSDKLSNTALHSGSGSGQRTPKFFSARCISDILSSSVMSADRGAKACFTKGTTPMMSCVTQATSRDSHSVKQKKPLGRHSDSATHQWKLLGRNSHSVTHQQPRTGLLKGRLPREANKVGRTLQSDGS